ncbi:conserved hypothetical protein [Psychromonas ingrahamii 37]|uniref:DUF2202 domain-containing protein n=1 Tax=Psychromonas ingrahamii (strain DSM 17664 / CCUG 51855 / 37) TaxID=357804 RepID=A1SST8_PSYIN|nr:DUF2202 domain-containing protein [Psychromonas ingrahamii]ABM02553.1 conserved hypothetical protein [Psychromonas ingrahamii 37]
MNKILISVIFILIALLGANTLVAKYYGAEAEKVLVPPLVALDVVEVSHLTFMREEEKFARDVYLTLAEQYPQQKIFKLIATGAEQIHTDMMRDKLEMFNVPDPNPNSDNLSDIIGVFAGAEWGWYFTEQYQFLIDQGMISELEALYVAAYIEELNIKDIALCPDVMIDNGYPSPCGLAYTTQKALQTAYNTLLSGSENHLRAFVRRIEAVIGEGDYEAQYLTQAEMDTILGR